MLIRRKINDLFNSVYSLAACRLNTVTKSPSKLFIVLYHKNEGFLPSFTKTFNSSRPNNTDISIAIAMIKRENLKVKNNICDIHLQHPLYPGQGHIEGYPRNTGCEVGVHTG